MPEQQQQQQPASRSLIDYSIRNTFTHMRECVYILVCLCVSNFTNKKQDHKKFMKLQISVQTNSSSAKRKKKTPSCGERRSSKKQLKNSQRLLLCYCRLLIHLRICVCACVCWVCACTCVLMCIFIYFSISSVLHFDHGVNN